MKKNIYTYVCVCMYDWMYVWLNHFAVPLKLIQHYKSSILQKKKVNYQLYFMKLRLLLLGRKAMTNLYSILKSRDITLPTKVHIVKTMVFPVVMYGCESWTIKKLSTEKLMLLNFSAGEDSWESLGLQGDQINQS